MKIKIKKVLLLAPMALAVIAFTAPAAQAIEWSSEGTFEASGEIGSAGGGLVTGPGDVHIHGELFNGVTMGEGFIDSAEITSFLATNLPGCHARATATANSETAWPITLTSLDTVIIGGLAFPVTFINHYTDSSGNPGCAPFKVPATVPVEGLITGTIENDGEGNACIDLNNHTDDMVNELSGGAVNLYTPEVGKPLCIEGVEVE